MVLVGKEKRISNERRSGRTELRVSESINGMSDSAKLPITSDGAATYIEIEIQIIPNQRGCRRHIAGEFRLVSAKCRRVPRYVYIPEKKSGWSGAYGHTLSDLEGGPWAPETTTKPPHMEFGVNGCRYPKWGETWGSGRG